LEAVLSGAVSLEAEAPLISGALSAALGLLDQNALPFSRPMAEKVEVTEATLSAALGLLGQYLFSLSRPMEGKAGLSAAESAKVMGTLSEAEVALVMGTLSEAEVSDAHLFRHQILERAELTAAVSSNQDLFHLLMARKAVLLVMEPSK
jgi:hypothetical protein